MRLHRARRAAEVLKAFGDHRAPTGERRERWQTPSSPARSSAARGRSSGCVGDGRYGLHYTEEFTRTRHRLRQPAAGRGNHRHLRERDPPRRRAAPCGPRASRCPATCARDTFPADQNRRERSSGSSRATSSANPSTGQHAIREALKVAKIQRHEGRAATCSDAFVPQVFGDAFRESTRAK